MHSAPAPKRSPKPLRLGILGGGQLGWLLGEAAVRAGLDVRVRIASEAEPAFVKGLPCFVGGLEEFVSDRGAVVFENEFVDCDALERSGARFFPSLSAIRLFQDKLRQKEELVRMGLPTAEFLVVDAVDEALRAFDGEAVLKWSRQGYDGKGVLALPATQERIEEFLKCAADRGGKVYAERRVKFSRELALVSVAPAGGGGFQSFPLVLSRQSGGACDLVTGPASLLGVPQEIEQEAVRCARAVSSAHGLLGAFALEFFLEDGRLLINEIAPRVHNSGHFTTEAFEVSQFEAHVRAAAGLPVPLLRPRAEAFAMKNVLGTGTRDPIDEPVAPEGWKLYWYGKSGSKPGRKLGHLNWAGALTELSGAVERIELAVSSASRERE